MDAQARRAKAIKFMESKGYQVCQRNGQRISIFANNKRAPTKEDCERCEVFIGKIPRDLYEDDLVPHLESAGRVHKVRLMMDFSGTNRGFGYALYTTPMEAANACTLLNQTKLRPTDTTTIGVLPSFNNRRLYFGDLPLECTGELLLAELRKLVAGVESVDMPELEQNSTCRHAFITFETHDAATQARRVLIPADVKIFDRQVCIDWAKPKRSGGSLTDLLDTSRSSSESLANQENNKLVHPSNQPIIDFTITNDTNNNNNSNVKQLQQSIGSHEILTPIQQPIELLQQPQPLQNPLDQHILGPSARQLMMQLSAPADNVLTVYNVDLKKASQQQLRKIFDLSGFLDIVELYPLNDNTLCIVYQTAEQAKLMHQIVFLYSCSFNELSLPNRILHATT